MKQLNVLISVFVLLLISEPLIGGQQDAKHLRVFGAINPTIWLFRWIRTVIPVLLVHLDRRLFRHC